MRRMIAAGWVGCLTVLLATSALARDRFLVIKDRNWNGRTQYVVMTPAEYEAAQNEIAAENWLRSKATSLAQKEWQKDTDMGRLGFPREVTTARNLSLVRACDTRDEADKEARKQIDRMSKKAEAEAKKESNRKRGRSKAQNQRDAERAAEKQKIARKARLLYVEQLAAVSAAKASAKHPPETKPEVAKPGAVKPDAVKPDAKKPDAANGERDEKQS